MSLVLILLLFGDLALLLLENDDENSSHGPTHCGGLFRILAQINPTQPGLMVEPGAGCSPASAPHSATGGRAVDDGHNLQGQLKLTTLVAFFFLRIWITGCIQSFLR